MQPEPSHSKSTSNAIAEGLIFAARELLGNNGFSGKLTLGGEDDRRVGISCFGWVELSAFLNQTLIKYRKNAARGLSQRMGNVFFSVCAAQLSGCTSDQFS
jgi:hypothetical protein